MEHIHEAHREHVHHPRKKKVKDYATLAIIGILLVFSLGQAYQIDSLQDSLELGEISYGSTSGSSYSSSESSGGTMVGGC